MSSSKPKFSCAELVDRAQQLAAGGNIELATQFLRKAMKQDPSNVEALEGLGELLMEQGLVEEAKDAFLKSIAVNPQDSGGKFMYLAQLQQGMEALESFQQGLSLLKRDLDIFYSKSGASSSSSSSNTNTEGPMMLKRQLCTGYCSVAELWMSDLCFEPNAEQECDVSLQSAVEYGPDNPEALQAMASFRISQHRSDDANKLMDLALAKLQTLKQNDENDGDDMMQVEEEGDDETAEFEPPFEFRVQTARILLELNRPKDSVPLLERLLREDDDVLEVWVLLAQAHMCKGGDLDAVDECLTRADEMLHSFLGVDPNDEHFSLQQKRLKAMRAEMVGLKKGGGVAGVVVDIGNVNMDAES